ncbi:hypothetical protein D3C78_1376980 [compost metagenome]
MEAILEHCCGLDVHRDTVMACLLTGTSKIVPTKKFAPFQQCPRAYMNLRPGFMLLLAPTLPWKALEFIGNPFTTFSKNLVRLD